MCVVAFVCADDWGPVLPSSADPYVSDDEDNPAQESFFSQVGQRESHWFHLSAASNHFQSSDSLSAGGTPTCSSIQGLVSQCLSA